MWHLCQRLASCVHLYWATGFAAWVCPPLLLLSPPPHWETPSLPLWSVDGDCFSCCLPSTNITMVCSPASRLRHRGLWPFGESRVLFCLLRLLQTLQPSTALVSPLTSACWCWHLYNCRNLRGLGGGGKSDYPLAYCGAWTHSSTQKPAEFKSVVLQQASPCAWKCSAACLCTTLHNSPSLNFRTERNALILTVGFTVPHSRSDIWQVWVQSASIVCKPSTTDKVQCNYQGFVGFL